MTDKSQTDSINQIALKMRKYKLNNLIQVPSSRQNKSSLALLHESLPLTNVISDTARDAKQQQQWIAEDTAKVETEEI